MDATLMSTAKHLVITLAVALGLAAPLATPAPAHAQEIEVKGPLAGAPAVIGMRKYREMRFQIQLQSTITLQDEYSRSILGGGQLMFHPTDWLGIGVWGGYTLAHIDTNLTDQVAAKGQTNEVNVLSLPNAREFPSQIATLNWMAAPEVQFIPLRGKLGIFEKLFIDTDLYLFGGVAFVGLEERANVTEGDFDACKAEGGGSLANQIICFERGQDRRSSRTTVAPTFGVGLSLYMAEFLAMTIEWRAMPFSWNTSGTDESGDAHGDFPDDQINEKDRLSHFNHMMTLGFAFYLPTEPRRSHSDTEASKTEGSASFKVDSRSRDSASSKRAAEAAPEETPPEAAPEETPAPDAEAPPADEGAPAKKKK
jgi:outer membrane beta-barrel protein